MRKLILSGLGGIAALAVAGSILASSAGAVATPTLPPVLHDRPDPLPVGAADGHPDRRAGDRGALGLRRAGSPGRVQARRLRGDARRHADGRARGRVRRPDDRVGPQRVPLVLRARRRARPRTAASRRSTRTASRATTRPSPTPTGSRRSRSTSEMVSAICPKCHILLVEANSADEAIATSNPVQHSDLGAVGRHRREPRRDRGLEQLRLGRAGAGPDLLRPLLQPSGRRDHGGHRRLRLRHDRGRRTSPYVTAVGGTELVAGSDHGARLERVGLGQRLPRRPPERRAGHRQRLLDLGAEAGVAARRRLREPHGRRRLGGRRQRRDLRQLAGDRRLGRRRRHEHRARRSSPPSTRSPGTRSRSTYGSYPYSHTSGLFDVTTGSNMTPTTTCGYLCQAGPGYDGPTGNGTPNGISGF